MVYKVVSGRDILELETKMKGFKVQSLGGLSCLNGHFFQSFIGEPIVKVKPKEVIVETKSEPEKKEPAKTTKKAPVRRRSTKKPKEVKKDV